MTDAEKIKVLADAEAASEKKRRAACIASASECVATATAGLAAIKGGEVTDEARLATMAKLREAINHINEAG